MQTLGLFQLSFLNTGSNSQATSCSNWSQECKSSREIFNEAMESLSNGQYKPLKTQPSQPLAELSSSSRNYYIRQTTSALKFICESIAPGQALDLLEEVILSTQSPQHDKKARPMTDALTETVIEAYTKADDYNTRTQILSLIANKYTKSELLSLIDGLSVHKIDSARKYASTHEPGQYIAPPKVTRVRLTKGQIQHFIEFISTQRYLQTVGFGSVIWCPSQSAESDPNNVSISVDKCIQSVLPRKLIKNAITCHPV